MEGLIRGLVRGRWKRGIRAENRIHQIRRSIVNRVFLENQRSPLTFEKSGRSKDQGVKGCVIFKEKTCLGCQWGRKKGFGVARVGWVCEEKRGNSWNCHLSGIYCWEQRRKAFWGS